MRAKFPFLHNILDTLSSEDDNTDVQDLITYASCVFNHLNGVPEKDLVESPKEDTQ